MFDFAAGVGGFGVFGGEQVEGGLGLGGLVGGFEILAGAKEEFVGVDAVGVGAGVLESDAGGDEGRFGAGEA